MTRWLLFFFALLMPIQFAWSASEHGQCAQRAVGHVVVWVACAAQVTQQVRWRVQKCGKTRPVATHKAPHQPEQQQRQHRIAKAKVPDHGIAAYFCAHNRADDGGSQGPVKQAGWKVPDADGVVHGAEGVVKATQAVVVRSAVLHAWQGKLKVQQ